MVSYNLNNWCKKIDPERVVTSLVSSDKLIKLTVPSKASELFCPNCESKNGWWNPSWDAWSCMEDACLEANRWCKDENEHALAYMQDTGSLPSNHLFLIPDMPLIYKEATLKNCEQTETVLKQLHEWAQKPTEMLILSGGAGRGKTYATCGLLNDYRSNKVPSERFSNVAELYVSWKQAMSERQEINLIEKFTDPKYLAIDDLGARTPTDAFLDFLYLIINRRINSNKGLIITTNLSSSEMTERLGEVITSRISSGKAIRFIGRDRRIKW